MSKRKLVFLEIFVQKCSSPIFIEKIMFKTLFLLLAEIFLFYLTSVFLVHFCLVMLQLSKPRSAKIYRLPSPLLVPD